MAEIFVEGCTGKNSTRESMDHSKRIHTAHDESAFERGSAFLQIHDLAD